MEINWFTFCAQILNFFVLVFVLQRLLYKPITQAMERREQTIRDRLLSAAQQKQEAQQEVEHYQKIQQDFAARQGKLLAQAKLEVEQTRQRLLQEVHQAVATERSQWQANLQRQQESFLREVRHHTMQQLQATVRRVLADLAESELEAQIARVFLQRLRDLKDTDRAKLVEILTAAAQDGVPLTVVSTFALPIDLRSEIATILQNYFGAADSAKIELTYEIQSGLICGIELRGTGYKLAWSMDAYLETISENLVTVFAEESGAIQKVEEA